jgi:hypothetical protein
MKPDTKDRLICSVAGGVVIPASYFFLIGILDRVGIGHSWLQRLLVPLTWPAYLCEYFLPALKREGIFRSHFGTEAFLLIVIANFVLYSLLTYAGILWRHRMPRLR